MHASPVDTHDAFPDTRVDVVPGAEPGAVLVVVRGDIDTATAPGLRDRLSDVLARPDTVEVVVDLSEVTFLDSAGLSTLAGAHLAAKRSSRTLLLRCGQARAVLRPLQITGLWDVLPRTPD